MKTITTVFRRWLFLRYRVKKTFTSRPAEHLFSHVVNQKQTSFYVWPYVWFYALSVTELKKLYIFFWYSPRLSSRDAHISRHPTPPVISLPKLKNTPNHVVSTPRRLLQPIHNQGLSITLDCHNVNLYPTN